MLKTLVKKQLMEIFRSYFYNAKTNKKRSTAGIIAYILLFAALMIGGIGGMFTGLSVSLCAPLTQAGMGWLYFALMSLLAIFLGAFGSVFNTYSGLYFAKDNDLLLSLPIPVRTLMASRLRSVRWWVWAPRRWCRCAWGSGITKRPSGFWGMSWCST